MIVTLTVVKQSWKTSIAASFFYNNSSKKTYFLTKLLCFYLHMPYVKKSRIFPFYIAALAVGSFFRPAYLESLKTGYLENI